MEWDDPRPSEVLDIALAFAARDAEHRLHVERVDGARECFGGEDGLLLALHRRWLNALAARLRAHGIDPGTDSAFCETTRDQIGEPTGEVTGTARREIPVWGSTTETTTGPADLTEVVGEGRGVDGVDAVSDAWLAGVRDRPSLRAVLDAHLIRSAALREAHEAELRMLAIASGLAAPGEPRDEVTGVGETIVALLRHRAGIGHGSDRGAVSRPPQQLTAAG